MNGLLIIGAGGHGKVVADTACESGQWEKIAFLDDEYLNIHKILDWPVLDNLCRAEDYKGDYPDLVVAIGNNSQRLELLKKYQAMGFKISTVVHPKAFVSKNSQVLPGTVVFAQAAVNAGATIGYGSIVNTGATIDHDCVIGEGVHICPGVHLAGNVKVGNFSWIGIGTTVVQQVSIGENVFAAAGSVITKDVADGAKVMGVPGRVVERNE